MARADEGPLELVEIPCDICGSGDWLPYRQVGEWRLVRCAGCGVVRLNPRPSEAELGRLYSQEYFASYEVQHDHSPEAVAQEVEVRLDAAEGLARQVKGACRWLDVGCASGYLIAAGMRLGYEVEGVEISEWAARFAAQELGLPVFWGTLSEYFTRFRERSFNLVTAMAYLEHSSYPRQDLNHIAELLEPGGVAVMRVPNLTSFDRLWHGPAWRGWQAPYHLYHFTPKHLMEAMRRQGLEPYKIDLGFWNPAVHLREGLRGDGLRADHPLEGRGPWDTRGRALSGRDTTPTHAARIWLKSILGRAFTGRDMIIYARK
jgi:SAM-dependent methyltransferase